MWFNSNRILGINNNLALKFKIGNCLKKAQAAVILAYLKKKKERLLNKLLKEP